MTVDCCTGSERFVNENCIRMMKTAAAAMPCREKNFFVNSFFQDPKRAAAAIPTHSTKEEMTLSAQTELHRAQPRQIAKWTKKRSPVAVMLHAVRIQSDKLYYLVEILCPANRDTFRALYYCWRTDALFEAETTSAEEFLIYFLAFWRWKPTQPFSH